MVSLSLLDYLDQRFARHHLFKKSIILIKSWCSYQARILGSQNACLGTYALEIMIASVLNNFYNQLYSPFQVFVKFFQFFANFQWQNYILTLYGPIKTLNFYDHLKMVLV
jgi:poly(A) polymerase Pap1